jgi:hypothetical protein
MTKHTLSLPENIYQRLLSVAQAHGISPAQWIATQLPPTPQPPADFPDDLIGSIDSGAEPRHPDEIPPIRNRHHEESDETDQPLSELLAGLIGTIDSQKNPHVIECHKTKKPDAFGEALIAKMAKQGIYLP